MLTYKGYKGQIEVDTDAGILFSRVLDIRDVITFKGETVEEAVQAFQDSVDDYLELALLNSGMFSSFEAVVALTPTLSQAWEREQEF